MKSAVHSKECSTIKMALFIFIVFFGVLVLVIIGVQSARESAEIASARKDNERRNNWLNLEGRFMCASGVFMYFIGDVFSGPTRAKHFAIARFITKVNGIPYDRIQDLVNSLCSLNHKSELFGGLGSNLFSPSEISVSHGSVVFCVDRAVLVQSIYESLPTHNVLVSDVYQPLIRLNPDSVALSSDSNEWMKLEVSALYDFGSDIPSFAKFRFYLLMPISEAASEEDLIRFLAVNHGFGLMAQHGESQEAAKHLFALARLSDGVKDSLETSKSVLVDYLKNRERAGSSPVGQPLLSEFSERISKTSHKIQGLEVLSRQIAQNSKDLFNAIVCQYTSSVTLSKSATLEPSYLDKLVSSSHDCYNSAAELGLAD